MVSVENLRAGEHSSFWEEVGAAANEKPSSEQVRDLAQGLTDALEGEKSDLLAFDTSRTKRGEPFVHVEKEQDGGHFWIVGDLHGDILGLETVLHYLRTQIPGGPHSIVFLGDLFDRGKHGGAVLYRVLKLIVEERGRHGFIVGNHDAGLQYNPESECFSSDVQPSEFADWVNAEPRDSAWRQLARAAIDFFAYAPRAVLLADGLLIAHGGVPHVDLQAQIKSRDDLNASNMQTDFVWTRLHDSAKKKIPNRTTRGCSLGISDFDAFCSRMEEIHLPVRALVRGHDHLEARYRFFEKYEQHSVLTINTMCYRQEGETFGDFHRPTVVAVRNPGNMPVVHELTMPRELVEQFYGTADVPVP